MLHDGRAKVLERWAGLDKGEQLRDDLLDDRTLTVVGECVFRFELAIDEYLSLDIWDPEPFVPDATSTLTRFRHNLPQHLLEARAALNLGGGCYLNYDHVISIEPMVRF